MPIAVSAPARRISPAVIAALAGGIMLASTLALWAYHGTAVFYEMILTGLAACF